MTLTEALAEHFELLAAHDDRRVLVNTQTDLARALCHGQEQAAEAAALLEVLVYEHVVKEPHPRPQLHDADAEGHFGSAARDYDARHHGRARARPGEDQSFLVPPVKGRIQLRPAEQPGDPELIAPGEENRGRRLDGFDGGARVSVPPPINLQDTGFADPEPVENFDVPASDFGLRFRGDRNDHNGSVRRPAEADEFAKYLALSFLVLGAADNYQRPRRIARLHRSSRSCRNNFSGSDQ
ncbi:MAG TPA: hypothetical protein VD861_21805 [Pyrinomonadaceae bacterium]|nr:hypothetical protein [Pyrinomonadaceae bacterium]